jgi:hypothetical protein
MYRYVTYHFVTYRYVTYRYVITPRGAAVDFSQLESTQSPKPQENENIKQRSSHLVS